MAGIERGAGAARCRSPSRRCRPPAHRCRPSTRPATAANGFERVGHLVACSTTARVGGGSIQADDGFGSTPATSRPPAILDQLDGGRGFDGRFDPVLGVAGSLVRRSAAPSRSDEHRVGWSAGWCSDAARSTSPRVDWGIPCARVLAEMCDEGDVRSYATGSIHASGSLDLGRHDCRADPSRALLRVTRSPGCWCRCDRCKLHHVVAQRQLLPRQLAAALRSPSQQGSRHRPISHSGPGDFTSLPDGTIRNTGPPTGGARHDGGTDRRKAGLAGRGEQRRL